MCFVVLIGLAIKIVHGIIANIGHGNLSLCLLQIHHKFPCPICAIIPNTVSLVAFYWNHKPLAGEKRLAEDREKAELAQVFKKCDDIATLCINHSWKPRNIETSKQISPNMLYNILSDRILDKLGAAKTVNGSGSVFIDEALDCVCNLLTLHVHAHNDG